MLPMTVPCFFVGVGGKTGFDLALGSLEWAVLDAHPGAFAQSVGVANFSPSHLLRVYKSNECNRLRKSAQLLSQAGVNPLISMAYAD